MVQFAWHPKINLKMTKLDWYITDTLTLCQIKEIATTVSQYAVSIKKRGITVQSRLSTMRPVITLIGCKAVIGASRFFGR